MQVLFFEGWATLYWCEVLAGKHVSRARVLSFSGSGNVAISGSLDVKLLNTYDDVVVFKFFFL